MSARSKLLAATLGTVVATTACSGIVQDSTRGSTLPPLDVAGAPPTDPATATTMPVSSSSIAVATTSAPTTSSSTLPATTFTTSTVPATSTALAPSTVPQTTTTAVAAESQGSGVRATIAGRSIVPDEACLDGRNVTLNGVTWAFAGNSFRLAGDGDVRSEAELVGDGWTMPMLVASVSGRGVYTYVGTGSSETVSSATVIVDHGVLRNC